MGLGFVIFLIVVFDRGSGGWVLDLSLNLRLNLNFFRAPDHNHRRPTGYN